MYRDAYRVFTPSFGFFSSMEKNVGSLWDPSHPRRKRRTKGIKAQEGKYHFVLGHDTYMDRVKSLYTRALVGRLEYCHLGKKEWVEWANEHWKSLLTYIPTISLLSKG